MVKTVALGLLVVSVLPSACASKQGDTGGPTAPTSNPSSGNAPPVGGPLAQLDARAAKEEMWSVEGGPMSPFLFFDAQRLRLSAGCRQPNGALDCDALRFVRNGTPVEIPRRKLDGRMSAGTLICTKLAHQSVTGRNAVGSEDGFCKFPDGSLISVGSLENYSLRVLE